MKEGIRMKFTSLTLKEFTTFADQHEQITFHQTTSWANLKKINNWTPHYVGIKNQKKILAASLILEKKTPLHKSIFYAPRGFLIDYDDKELITYFTTEIKQYIKDHNGIFVKIDPYIMYQERDQLGNIVENGINHKTVVKTLKNLGYRHKGFTMYQETLQPRWLFVLPIKDHSYEEIKQNFDSKTKRILKKNAKMNIKVRELSKEEIPIYKQIIQSTSNRREFVDRPLSYYENMWDAFHDDGHLKIMVAELHVKKYIATLKQEIKQLKEEQRIREERRKTEDVNEKKYLAKKQQSEEKLSKAQHQIAEMEELKEKYGDIIILGGMLFLLYGKEIVFLMGGSFEEFLPFQSSYSIHEYMIEYAIKNGYEAYNFYGITGIFDESNPLYGIYFAKKGFGGKVVELIGEFDLITNKLYYYIYRMSFAIYHTTKNFIQHLKKN